MWKVGFIMCTLKHVFKYEVVLYPCFKSNIWQMCKKQKIATACEQKKNKRLQHQFLKVGTLSEFERQETSLNNW